jgi:uncharacterized protein YecE (DUF72 family)
MAKRKTKDPQLGLFGTGDSSPPWPEREPLEALAGRLPERVRLGTSSWTFEGWQGLVYHRQYTKAAFTRESLAEYAAYPLFRTVGIDSTYYTPPRAELLARYAAQLPPGFVAVSKVWEHLTLPVFPEHRRYGQNAGRKNPHYLDAAVFEDLVLSVYARDFRPFMGPFVFELAPMRPEVRPEPEAFAESLDAFFGRLPRGPAYAVEIRNRELLTPGYLDVLRRHGVGHVLNQWSFMPSVGQQAQLDGILTAPHVVVRLLLRPGTRYEQRIEQMAPFDRIVDADPRMRKDVAHLALRAARAGHEVYVIVNNKAEGSAPLTVRGIAEEILTQLDGEPF